MTKKNMFRSNIYLIIKSIIYHVVPVPQTLENHQRRKDINQGLTLNMSEIFAFFMRLIEQHVQEFREKTAAGDYAVAASHVQVVQVNNK